MCLSLQRTLVSAMNIDLDQERTVFTLNQHADRVSTRCQTRLTQHQHRCADEMTLA